MNPHPHAENMRLYAEDAAETDKPWRLWEFRSVYDACEWWPVNEHPNWCPTNVYRRKPKPLECWVNITYAGRAEVHLTKLSAVADSSPSYKRIAVHMREVTE